MEWEQGTSSLCSVTGCDLPFMDEVWSEPVGPTLHSNYSYLVIHNSCSNQVSSMIRGTLRSICLRIGDFGMDLTRIQTILTGRLGANKPLVRKENSTDGGWPRFHIQSRSHPLRRELPQRLGGASGLLGPPRIGHWPPASARAASSQGHLSGASFALA